MRYFYRNFVVIFFLAIVLIPGVVSGQAQCVPGQQSTNELCSPIVNAPNLKQFFLNAIAVFASFTLIIPIMALSFAGLLMITAAGSEEQITRAKTAFTWTIYGFLIAVFAFVLVFAMADFLGADRIPDPLAPPEQQTKVDNPLFTADFVVFLKKLLTNFLGLIMALAVLMLIVSGFRYVTSAGNEEQASKGKQGIKWAVFGIITVLLAYVIMRALATLIGLPQ